MSWSIWLEFNKFDIGSAPTTIGVYCLRRGGEMTYYGKAEGPGGIHGRLLEHLQGKEGDCTRWTNGYCYRECDDPTEAFDRMLAAYVEEHAKPPRCNEVPP
ncbi:MAG: hypothetical protein IIC73_00810 [Armatimonadetes bacterium]|nr:hypothetical protein [Armatimonadota bacterium]